MPKPFYGGRGPLPQTMVFWDIEDCPVPDVLKVSATWDNIRGALYDNIRRFDVIGFGDIIQDKSYFGAGGVRIIHVSKGKNDERRNFILVKLLVEAIGADYDTNFVVIVGDISGQSGFFRALGHLKFKTSNHVILAQTEKVVRKLQRRVTSTWASAREGPSLHQTKRRRLRSERFIVAANTVIFWDVVDCQIPDGLDVAQVSLNIKSALANCDIGPRMSMYPSMLIVIL